MSSSRPTGNPSGRQSRSRTQEIIHKPRTNDQFSNSQQESSKVQSRSAKTRTIAFRRVRHAKVSPSDYDRHCLICGMRAVNYNYGIISCESCKMFFRRNSWKMDILTCLKRNLGFCAVEPSNRRNCTACRLKKCLDLGMKRQLNSFDKKYRDSCPARPRKPQTLCRGVSSHPSPSTSSQLSSALPLPEVSNFSESPSLPLHGMGFEDVQEESIDMECNEQDTCRDEEADEPEPLVSLSEPFSIDFEPILTNDLRTEDQIDSVGFVDSFLSELQSSNEKEFSQVTLDEPRNISKSSARNISDLATPLPKKTLPTCHGEFAFPLLQDFTVHFPISKSLEMLRTDDIFMAILLEFVNYSPKATSTSSSSVPSCGGLPHLPPPITSTSANGPLTHDELHLIREVDSVFVKYQQQDYSSQMRDFLEAPSTENMTMAHEERARRAVLFSRQVYPFHQLVIDYQKLVMVMHIPVVCSHLLISHYDVTTHMLTMNIDDGTSLPYITQPYLNVLPNIGALLTLYYGFVQRLATVLGPTRSLHALFCCLKLFEIPERYQAKVPSEMSDICVDAFRLYVTLLCKTLHAETVPDNFRHRWLEFCYLYAWSRLKFDPQVIAAASGIEYMASPPCQLMQEVCITVQDLF